MLSIEIRPEDRGYFELWKQAAEIAPEHPAYELSLRWNLDHVARGEEYVAAVQRYRSIAGSRVLDVGSGSGGVCIAFARHGAVCTGVEPDPQRFEWSRVRTRDHGMRAELRNCTLEAAGFADRSFDIILATDVLEHVTDYRAAIREMCRLLAPGGVIYATVPNCFHIKNIVSENHTKLFGVLLLPSKWREFYVVNIRRAAKHYPVYEFPPCHTLVLECKALGVVTLAPSAFRRLQDVDEIRVRSLQRLLKLPLANRVAHRLVSWLGLQRTYVFVARRPEAQG